MKSAFPLSEARAALPVALPAVKRDGNLAYLGS
jgi:hypothetical protein